MTYRKYYLWQIWHKRHSMPYLKRHDHDIQSPLDKSYGHLYITDNKLQLMLTCTISKLVIKRYRIYYSCKTKDDTKVDIVHTSKTLYVSIILYCSSPWISVNHETFSKFKLLFIKKIKILFNWSFINISFFILIFFLQSFNFHATLVFVLFSNPKRHFINITRLHVLIGTSSFFIMWVW